MGKQSYYATSTNMAYVPSTGSTWTTGSARQGAYSSTRYYGVGMFTNIGQFSFVGKSITNIRLTMDFNAAGANGAKTLYLYRTSRTTIGGTGAAMLGVFMGSLKGTFYNNAYTWDFNAGSDPALFNELFNHFRVGGTGIAFYASESSPGTPAWSANYTSIGAITVTFTWADDFVWYNRNGVWVRCAAYYNQNGTWRRCKANYNRNGTWIK